MKYILFVVLFLSIACDNIVSKDEEACNLQGTTQCNKDILQYCIDGFWIEAVNCGNVDGGTCREINKTPMCI